MKQKRIPILCLFALLVGRRRMPAYPTATMKRSLLILSSLVIVACTALYPPITTAGESQ